VPRRTEGGEPAVKAILFLICGIVLANIVVATFIWPPSTAASGKPAPAVNAATRQGQDPWMVNERYNAPNRERIHKATLETLDKPWASHCTAEGHAFLIRSIDNYYWQREAQLWSYEHTYGDDARRYAIKAWTTTDDNRIARLISETYSRGYFALDELQSYTRQALAELVKGIRVSAKPCAS
jgi:hypothetical protein